MKTDENNDQKTQSTAWKPLNYEKFVASVDSRNCTVLDEIYGRCRSINKFTFYCCLLQAFSEVTKDPKLAAHNFIETCVIRKLLHVGATEVRYLRPSEKPDAEMTPITDYLL